MLRREREHERGMAGTRLASAVLVPLLAGMDELALRKLLATGERARFTAEDVEALGTRGCAALARKLRRVFPADEART